MNYPTVYHLLKTFSMIQHVLNVIFLQLMAQKSAAILPVSQISGQCETLHPIFQCIIYDLRAMPANICLTETIVNYHNNLPYVIMLNKIYLYLSPCNLQLQRILLFRICTKTTLMTFPTYYMLVRNDSTCHSTGDTLESANEQQSASSRNSDFKRDTEAFYVQRHILNLPSLSSKAQPPPRSDHPCGFQAHTSEFPTTSCSSAAVLLPQSQDCWFYGENGKTFSCTSHLF